MLFIVEKAQLKNISFINIHRILAALEVPTFAKIKRQSGEKARAETILKDNI